MWFQFVMTTLTNILGVDTDVLSAALDAGSAVGLILIYFWFVTLFFFFLSLLGVYMFIFRIPAYNTH